MGRSILIVDDDPRILRSLSRALAEDAEISTAERGDVAMSVLSEQPVDVVLADLKMPGMDGIELLKLLRERMPEVDVLIMTAYEDLPTVATAMREGARDFLVKPLDLHGLRRTLDRVFDDRATRDRLDRPPETDGEAQAPRLIGRHRRLVEIFKLVGQVAASRTTVVIRGESGTGKELIAREIHRGSPYAGEAFVPVDCTSIPATLLESELFGHMRGAFTDATRDRRGRFALAGRGTVFLDEIGDTTPEFQSKLLRVLQEHEFFPVGAEEPVHTEARVIAATHRDLEAMLAAGEFREDLYYRLRVVEIVVPPLRDRVSDIPLLAEHFVAVQSRSRDRPPPILAPEAIEALLAHRWPGNVRELENCIARAVVLAVGDVVRPEHLEFRGRGETSPNSLSSLDAVEGAHIARVLDAMDGHKTRSAEVLEISRPRLDRLIAKHGLEALARTRSTSGSSADS